MKIEAKKKKSVCYENSNLCQDGYTIIKSDWINKFHTRISGIEPHEGYL